MHLLIADEDFDQRVVRLLLAAGYDIITLQQLGLAGRAVPDDQILAVAITLERAILTFNRKHFIKLHKQSPKHFGIIICTRNPDYNQLWRNILDQLTNINSLHGKLIRVYRES